jgi:type VI secretion system protein ImpA
MGVLDVDQLLEPVSEESPCGEDLEYDLEYGELERAAQPVADQQIGNTVVERQEPDWRTVRDLASGLFQRTKDLRVAVLLARAVVHIDGIAGFGDALAVLRGLVERYWDSVHPRLDPDDDNDPTFRVNTLLALCDREACLRAVMESPLVESSALGSFSYRDYLVASGELPPRTDQPPEMSTIEAVLMNEDLNNLNQRAVMLQNACDSVRAIESAVTEAVGISRSASLQPIEDLLTKMSRLLGGYLERRGFSEVKEEAPVEEESPQFETSELSSDVSEDPAIAPPTPVSDKVSSRDDVIRLLDKICDYYSEHEPSSPVPLLLNRAKRVAKMSFLELLRELAPSGLDQAEALGGSSGNPSEDGGT